jgi:hypothetical protein
VKDRTDNELPNSTWLSTEWYDPVRTIPRTERPLPHRWKLRKLKELPKLYAPIAETQLPILANERSDIDDPMLPDCNMEKAEPIRAKLRADMLEPNSVLSRTEQ